MIYFLIGLALFICGLCFCLGYCLGEAREQKPRVRNISGHASKTLSQLAGRPRWDGDLMSKVGRDELFYCGLVERHNGWNFLTRAGIDFLKKQDLAAAKRSKEAAKA